MTCYVDDDLDSRHLIRLGALHGQLLISPRTIGVSGQHDARHLLYASLHGINLADQFVALNEYR